MNAPRWKVYECAADNAPCYYIVSDRAWKGEVIGRFQTAPEAQSFADARNALEGAP